MTSLYCPSTGITIKISAVLSYFGLPSGQKRIPPHNDNQAGNWPSRTVFNIVKWIRRLLQLREVRLRGKRISALFITTRGWLAAATRAVIAGWVRSALLAAGIDASPGSFRSAVGSSRLDSGSSLDDVLSRGNLRSCRTFFNHYYRQVQKSSSDWSIASVGSFSAVRQASQATANAVSLLVMVGFSYGIVFWADWAQLRSPTNIYLHSGYI